MNFFICLYLKDSILIRLSNIFDQWLFASIWECHTLFPQKLILATLGVATFLLSRLLVIDAIKSMAIWKGNGRKFFSILSNYISFYDLWNIIIALTTNRLSIINDIQYHWTCYTELELSFNCF